MPSATHPDLFGAPILVAGREVRLAAPGDMDAILALRARAFRDGAEDRDAFDADCLHLWVGRAEGRLAATVRLRRHSDAQALLAGYAATVYDLTAMAGAGGEVLELGRLCAEPGAGDTNLLKLLWAGVARLALATGCARLIGCTSFHTTDAASLDAAWALLAARHQGPEGLRPGRKAGEVYGFETITTPPNPGATALMPGLLRAYLAMGGWVSDHAVVDRDLGTCHVFTCVELDRMPPRRRRVMTQMAGGSDS